MPGGLWMIIFHELGIDTEPAENIPDWVGKLPIWACVLIPILIFAVGALIGMIPFIL